jgi:hypothetical protein
MKKFFVLLLLIIVFRVPLPTWKAMSENDREAVRLTVITEFCRMYAEKHKVFKFKIKEEIKGGEWRLHIIPQREVI